MFKGKQFENQFVIYEPKCQRQTQKHYVYFGQYNMDFLSYRVNDVNS